MSERQPPSVVEGATTGDVEDEIPNAAAAAKSAEDRKAASALASLESGDDARGKEDVDAEAAKKAIGNLGGGAAGGEDAATGDKKKTTTLPVRNVKVDPADVALLVDELEISKQKATEMLKSHDGDAVKAMRAFVNSGTGI